MGTPQKTSEQSAREEQRTEHLPSGSESSRNERDSLARLGAELLRRADETQPVLERAWNELMASWDIRGQPIGVECLRALIQQECGANAQDNAFSRELIELREERRS